MESTLKKYKLGLPKPYEQVKHLDKDNLNPSTKPSLRPKGKVEQAILEEYPLYNSQNQMEQFNQPVGKTKDLGSYYYIGLQGLQEEEFQSHVILHEVPTLFPESFKPRKAANMKAEEKVQNWIKGIPSRLDTDSQLIVDCFPATTSYTSSNSEISQMDLTDFDEILEIQARRVTRYATRIYLHEVEPTSEEVIDESFEYYNDDNYLDFTGDELIFYNAFNSQIQS